jgi:hypothetical protein
LWASAAYSGAVAHKFAEQNAIPEAFKALPTTAGTSGMVSSLKARAAIYCEIAEVALAFSQSRRFRFGPWRAIISPFNGGSDGH